jgi:radical SAM superfamily enzyme YgiQ (UPF0313 family)
VAQKVMKLINKPLIWNSVRLIRKMNQVGISSQACFVIGFPGENDEDRELTRQMVHQLTREGLDEVALFIVTPVPGSSIFKEFSPPDDYSQLNFSPVWRKDYAHLNQFRLGLYKSFLWWKLIHWPLKFIKQPFLFLMRRF